MMKNTFRFAVLAILITGISFQGCLSYKSPYGNGWSAVHADGHNSDYSTKRGARKIEFAWQRKFEGTINLGAPNLILLLI